ncbi:tyrosine-type recombinase/integrase, partial [Allosediminivita pacifica]
MPRAAKELSALEVKRLKYPGKGRKATFAVGGVSGLLLQITANGGRSWLLRIQVGEKRREIGLGGYPEVTLAAARERAREVKDQVRRGVDPVEDRKAARAGLVAAQRRGVSFAEAVDSYLGAKLDAFKNEKHQQQWRSTLNSYAIPELGKMLVQDITVQDVLRVLEPIWQTKTETASRLRGRIEAVLSWATVAGHRTGENPARWAGNLKELLPAPIKVAKSGNHPALQISDVHRWLGRVDKRVSRRPEGVIQAGICDGDQLG